MRKSILIIALVFLSSLVHAQNVVGVTAILGSTSSSEIDAYSATEIDYVVANSYQPYVEGYLYDNGSQIAWGSALGPDSGCSQFRLPFIACGYIQKPLIVGDTYEIDSHHYVYADTYVSDGYGNYYYYNPDQYIYNYAGPSGPSSSSYAPYQGGPVWYENVQFIALGATGIIMSSAPPTIQSVDNPNLTRNTGGTITVYGYGLTDVFSQAANVTISNSGVSIGIASQAWNQVKLNYWCNDSATAGASTLTFTTRFGSGSTTINVGDPSPQITSITANTAEQGDSLDVQINGKGFGTNPTVQISDSSIQFYVNHPTDTVIYATMNVADTSVIGTDTITVTSNGPTGQGFSGNPGQSAGSNSVNFTVTAGPGFQIVGASGGPGNQTISDGGMGTFTTQVTGGNPVSYQWSFSAPNSAGDNPNVNFTAATSQTTNTDSHWYANNPNTPNYCPPDLATGQQYWNAPYTIQASVKFDDGNSQKTINKKVTLTSNAAYEPFAGVVDPNCNPGDEACRRIIQAGGKAADPIFRITGRPNPGRFCQPSDAVCATAPPPGGGGINNSIPQFGPPPPASGDAQFALAINPVSTITDIHGTTHLTVTITPINGFTGIANLALTGVPAGSVGTLTPSSVDLSRGPGTSTIFFAADPDLLADSYPLTVSGVGAASPATAEVLLPPWHFTDKGQLARRIPTVAQVIVPATSQFYNKTLQHENKHLTQFLAGAGHIFGDLEDVDALWTSQVQNLSAATFSDLETQYDSTYLAWDNNQVAIFRTRLPQAEQEAHGVSDPIDPQYVYQLCGGNVQQPVKF